MAKTKKQSRKDSNGRVLKKGESQRKDGTYMYRYNDECGKRKSVYARNLTELREKEFHIEKDKADNIRVSVDYTVEQLIELYLALFKDKLAVTTQELALRSYELHIKNSWIAKKNIKEVKSSDVLLFYKDLSEIKSLSNSSIRIINNVMSNSFRIALNDQLIRINPTSGALKLYPIDSEERVTLTKTQVNDLITYVNNHPYYRRWYPLITIFLETMLRGSELCGLTWQDIDLKNRILNIDHQMQYKKINDKYTFFISSPKTKQGIRQIPISDVAYRAFLDQKQYQFSHNMFSKTIVDGYRNFVFPTRNGTPNHVILLDSMFRNMTNRYNLDNPIPIPHLTCHVLRHTGCAITAKKFFSLGLDPKILQKWMGHSSLEMTLKLYNHANNEDVQDAINKLNSIAV